MAACLHRGQLLPLLPAVLLSFHSPLLATEPVTSQDAALLAGVPEDILCFTRSFEDLTCFWDDDDEEEEEEAVSRMCHFYYWYSRDMPTACTVSTWRHEASRTRHVCIFPSQDVRLFTQLHLRVLDTTTNQTKYQRDLSVDAVGLIAPPVNITARWAGVAGQLCVSWQPPLADFLNFFLYEVQCCPASSSDMSCSTAAGQHPADPSINPAVSTHAPTTGAAAASPGAGQGLVQANTWVVLQNLRPGVRYHIQVRSKPDGTSMDGVWGPWSQAVAAETPHSSGDIGLCCSTPDLQQVRCEWSWDPTEPPSSHQLFYQQPPSGAGTREDAWQQCKEVGVGALGSHTCTFQPRVDSAISVLVNVTQPHPLPTLSYFKEPFWLHQAVLTEAPQIVQATVSQGRLSLQWLPPLEVLAEQLDYQVRYAVENSHDWKAGPSPVLRWYCCSSQECFWACGAPSPLSTGKGCVCGWGREGSITRSGGHQGTPGLGFAFNTPFPTLSNMKQKLWPPVPDLHRALGSFLHESSKHGQANAFYKQPPEEAVLPCLLEVLPGPRGEAGAPPPEHADRLPSTDIANQSYLLMSGWEPRGPPRAAPPALL
ncbi:thrombopoietin receptor isoform 2-T2 [Amazona ochrocephala]